MAKVAAPGPLPSNSIEIGGGALKIGKARGRKTPSELRGEQLKRTSVINLVDESQHLIGCANSARSEVDNRLKKAEISKGSSYVDTRLDEVYPVKKSRFRMLSGKENTKGDSLMGQTMSLKGLSRTPNLVTVKQHQLSLQKKFSAPRTVKDGAVHNSQEIEEGSQSTFRSVTELSTGGEKLSGIAVDMDKALMGLADRGNLAVSGFPADFSQRQKDLFPSSSGNFVLECHISEQKVPLDFTLKTSMRVVSSSSMNWIHRAIMSATVPQNMPPIGCQDQTISSSSGLSSTLRSKVLHSWVYPQSMLPPSLITVLISSASEGVESDFLRRRQIAWEDSFRSLYYMLRNNICKIFYVCTSNFVAMFIGGNGSRGNKHLCNAYLSQSTRGLRSLMSENDICFSMPLCRSKIEQVPAEDLVELSEIEKHNLGQTRRLSSFSDVDNSPQSMLAFSGHRNVHGLFDFLLNYRSFISTLTGVDVPVLYSPVPFQNAALSSPEIRCMEIKRADHIASLKGSISEGASISYSIEIEDAYIPPWIICNVCGILGSEAGSFEASFNTDPMSIGLNVAIETLCEGSEGENSKQNCNPCGIPDAVVSPSLQSCILKGLKYSDGSYTASLSPI